MCSAGQATGDVPTKTEQGDLWQMLGAVGGRLSAGLIVAPRRVPLDLFPERFRLFNLCDKYQCPGLVLADLLISEGTSSVDPDELDFNVKIEDVAAVNSALTATAPSSARSFPIKIQWLQRQRPICVSRIPRAASPPAARSGVPGHIFLPPPRTSTTKTAPLSAMNFTNPHKRRLMVEKRARKMEGAY